MTQSNPSDTQSTKPAGWKKSTIYLTSVGLLTAAGLTLGAHAVKSAAEPDGRHHLPIDLAAMAERGEARFDALDIDTDGRVTREEFLAAPVDESMRHRHPGMRHKMKGLRRGKRDGGPGHLLSDDARAELRAEASARVFSELDSDGNGQLSAEEFANRRAVTADVRLGLHREHRFGKLDTNGDDQLTRDELHQRLDRLRALDTNGDGFVDRAELRAAKAARRQAQSS